MYKPMVCEMLNHLAYSQKVNIAMQGGLMDISVPLSLIPKPIVAYDLLRETEQLPLVN